MSPLAVRKTLISGPQDHNALHQSPHFRSRRAKPHSAVERIPPQQTGHYNEPAASDVLSTEGGPNPVVKTVSVKEAAFRLRKSPDSIYLWLRHGRLKGWQPGGPGCQIQVVESSVEQALQHILGAAAVSSGTA